jgi:hypothetical protein
VVDVHLDPGSGVESGGQGELKVFRMGCGHGEEGEKQVADERHDGRWWGLEEGK